MRLGTRMGTASTLALAMLAAGCGSSAPAPRERRGGTATPPSVTMALPDASDAQGRGGSVTVPLGSVESLENQLSATRTEAGTLVSLAGDVTFDYDRATIRAAARPTLDRLAALVNARAPAPVTIAGHTDSVGDERYNQSLSIERARAVRDYLISVRMVDGTRLTAKGWGELRPVAPNRTPEGRDDAAGRARNRRVEVTIGA